MSDSATTSSAPVKSSTEPDYSADYVQPSTTRDMNVYSYGFFFVSALMVLEGLDIYDYKLYDVDFRRDLFPKRIENVLAYDETWAKQTKEITAWTQMSELLIAVYGTAAVLFGINQNYDNEGGFWHNVYYRYASVARFAPIATIYQSLHIRDVYARSTEQFSQDASAYSALVYRYNPYMYDPAETDETAISYLWEEDFQRQSYLVLACLISTVVHAITFEGIKDEFLVKREAYLAKEKELESLAEYLEASEEEEQ